MVHIPGPSTTPLYQSFNQTNHFYLVIFNIRRCHQMPRLRSRIMHRWSGGHDDRVYPDIDQEKKLCDLPGSVIDGQSVKTVRDW